LLKTLIFHANSVDKLPKVHEQMNNWGANLNKEDVVSINTTEVSVPSSQFYSFTIVVTYQAKE